MKIFGVGISDCKKIPWSKTKEKAYSVWYDMLRRCYDERCHKVRPSYKKCTVCEEWLLFSNFKKWFDENYIEGYCLDKDIKQKNLEHKIYSPKTCLFVTKSENALECNSRKDYSWTKGENNFWYGKKGKEHPSYQEVKIYETKSVRVDQFKSLCKRHNIAFEDFEQIKDCSRIEKDGRKRALYFF